MTDFTPRPTVYKGIKMRSRLEAGFAAWLDDWGCTWSYEPECFASGRGQYLPDFEVKVGCPEYGPNNIGSLYIEVKPTWAKVKAKEQHQNKLIILENGTYNTQFAVAVRDDDFPVPCVYVPLSNSSWLRYIWTPFAMFDDADVEHPLTVAAPMGKESGPWPDGYWKRGT